MDILVYHQKNVCLSNEVREKVINLIFLLHEFRVQQIYYSVNIVILFDF
jgi:hypothetical protein